MVIVTEAGPTRADFPGCAACQRYHWTSDRLGLPDETRLFVGDDYCPDGRKVACAATVAEQRRDNKHVHDGVDEAEFVALRTKRDGTLPLPELMLAALQVNIRGGRLPDPEPCGDRKSVV